MPPGTSCGVPPHPEQHQTVTRGGLCLLWMLAPATARPILRGYVHLAAALAAPFALVALLLAADSARGYVGGAVFGASLILLFTTSASYHLIPWLPRFRPIARRVDHSMIFVAVAGFYTPFCLQVLGAGWGIPLLVTVWVLAAAGVALEQAWPGAPAWLSLGAYLCIGWVALVALVPLAASLSPLAMAGLVASGVLYSVGGVIFATGWPSPAPRVFGHHEIFHSLVAAGSAVLLCVVMTDVLPR